MLRLLSHIFQADEAIKDDFLFPMSNRLSYASSPESDLDLRPGSMYGDEEDASPVPRRKLVRSSSDPSIATGENVPGIPPYPAPPNYHQDFRPVRPQIKLQSAMVHCELFQIVAGHCFSLLKQFATITGKCS